MTQDYLIVRVAGLFDNNNQVASFGNFCPDNSDYLILKQESIIKYIIKLRNTFVAHSNLECMENGQYPATDKMLKSNLLEILQKLLNLVNEY